MRVRVCLFLIFAAVTCQQIRYDNWQGWATPSNQRNFSASQLSGLNTIAVRSRGQILILLNRYLVPPAWQSVFPSWLNEFGIPADLLWENFQEALDTTAASPQPGPYRWDRYHTLDEVNAFLDKQIRSHPKVVTPLLAGYSVEGRPIRGIKISYGLNKIPRTVFIEASIHAAEWIAYESANYLIDRLLNDKSLDGHLLRLYDWIIFPVANPDGLVYTQDINRVWRANRRINPNSTCVGVDLNRNFGYGWGGAGSSKNPCSFNYQGSAAFSEPETQAIRDAVLPIKENIDLYLSLHSFGQYLLWDETTAVNLADTEAVGKAAVDVIKAKGTTYVAGDGSKTLYPTLGTSTDWATAELRIPLVYTVELQPAFDSKYMFFLPTDRIQPNVEEFYAGVVAMVTEAKNRGYFQYEEATIRDLLCKFEQIFC